MIRIGASQCLADCGLDVLKAQAPLNALAANIRLGNAVRNRLDIDESKEVLSFLGAVLEVGHN